MTKPIKFIIYTSEEYRNEKRRQANIQIFAIWNSFVALGIFLIFLGINSVFAVSATIIYVIIAFVSDFNHGKIGAYAKAVKGFYYLSLALFFLIIFIYMIIFPIPVLSSYDSFVLLVPLLFMSVFSYLGYKRINDNTNLIEILKHDKKKVAIISIAIFIFLVIIFSQFQGWQGITNNNKIINNSSINPITINTPTIVTDTNVNTKTVEININPICDTNAFFSKETGNKLDYNKIWLDNTQISLPYKNKSKNIDVPSYVSFDIHNNNPYSVKFEITYEVKNIPNHWTKSYTLNLELNKNDFESIKEVTDPCGNYALSGGPQCQVNVISINEIENDYYTIKPNCKN